MTKKHGSDIPWATSIPSISWNSGPHQKSTWTPGGPQASPYDLALCHWRPGGKKRGFSSGTIMTHCWNRYWQTSVNGLVQYLNIQVFPHWITIQSRFCHRYVTAKEWHAWFWNAAHVAETSWHVVNHRPPSGAVEGSQQHSRRDCLKMGDPPFQYGISLIFQTIAFRIFGKPTLFGQTNSLLLKIAHL